MVDDLDINYDQTSMSFPTQLRGDASVEDMPALVNQDEEVMVIDRKYLGDFISGFGLVRRTGKFPQSIRHIDQTAFDYPDEHFEIYELVDGDYVGLASEVLKSAVVFCLADGVQSYDRDGFELYRPTGSADAGVAPFFLASDYTPEEFVIHRLFGSYDAFVAEYGAAACPECEEVFEDHFVDCPDCGRRPESVRNNIHLIQEEHHGVVVGIAPVLIQEGGSTYNDIEEGKIEPRPPLEGPSATVEVIESPGAASQD